MRVSYMPHCASVCLSVRLSVRASKKKVAKNLNFVVYALYGACMEHTKEQTDGQARHVMWRIGRPHTLASDISKSVQRALVWELCT